jgi:hypothetical protein
MFIFSGVSTAKVGRLAVAFNDCTTSIAGLPMSDKDLRYSSGGHVGRLRLRRLVKLQKSAIK